MSQSTAPPATAATRRVLTRPEAVAALRDRTAPPPWCGAGCATHGLCRNVWRCIRRDHTDRRDFLDGVRRGVWTVLE